MQVSFLHHAFRTALWSLPRCRCKADFWRRVDPTLKHLPPPRPPSASWWSFCQFLWPFCLSCPDRQRDPHGRPQYNAHLKKHRQRGSHGVPEDLITQQGVTIGSRILICLTYVVFIPLQGLFRLFFSVQIHIYITWNTHKRHLWWYTDNKHPIQTWY